MKIKYEIPNSPEAWLKEIATAYLGALETAQFGKLTGNKIDKNDLFHLGPAVCLKSRGINNTEKNLKKATDAALSSYVATEEVVGDLFKIPQMSFAYCYLASHFGLDLLDESSLSEVMNYIENNSDRLLEMTQLL